MDLARLIVLALTLLGAALPIYGAVSAVFTTRATLRKHEQDAALSRKITREWGGTVSAARDAKRTGSASFEDLGDELSRLNASFHARFKTQGLEVPSFETGNRNVTGDLAISRMLRLVARGNRANAALIILGVVLSAVAAVWSLFLPAA